jgi:tetratricopeptide (TPR) repeat protein
MVDAPSKADLIVIGADELPSNDYEQLLDDSVVEAAGLGALDIINETEFWKRTGIVEADSDADPAQLYTPAMLAELLEVSIATIRRWQRRGLIKPTRQVNKLPYFDFQEVASARRLARLIESGKSPQVIENKLLQLAQLAPELERPLSQLSIIVEGRDVLLRRGEGLIEPGGQKRIDFDAIGIDEQVESPDVIHLQSNELSIDGLNEFSRPEQFIELANQFEDLGESDTAIYIYRAMVFACGPSAESSFRLAELLYLTGQSEAARERYYMAVEMDERYVEARASLGCVLVELGEPEMAVSAFRGALGIHEEYPDVHFHLARLLDDLEQTQESETHWARFLELAPKSPWAQEARERLQSR